MHYGRPYHPEADGVDAYLLLFAVPTILWVLVILALALFANRIGRGIRINLLCAAGVMLSAIGVGFGWEYQHGDVGSYTGWSAIILAGAYISLVTPLGGFVQVIALLADFSAGYSEGTQIAGSEWFALAALGSMVVLVSILTPLGVNMNLRTAGTLGRLLTVSFCS